MASLLAGTQLLQRFRYVSDRETGDCDQGAALKHMYQHYYGHLRPRQCLGALQLSGCSSGHQNEVDFNIKSQFLAGLLCSKQSGQAAIKVK